MEPVVSMRPTPAGATVKIVERGGGGTPVVFLHAARLTPALVGWIGREA